MENESMFGELVERAKEVGGMEQIMRERESQYNLRKYKITEISVSNALPIYTHIVEKFYKNHNPGESGTWVENELRLFIWAVIAYLEIYQKSINSLNDFDWTYFSRIFYVKEYILFEYQARTLLDDQVKMAKWSNDEDCLLYNIITRERNAKWNQIAKALFVSSNKAYLRSSKQCRERWLNHLDPSKTKAGWSLEEFVVLFQHVLDSGKKWAVLVKKLGDRRSEHSIKNKYNSIIKKQGRLTPNLTENQICAHLVQTINRVMQTHRVEQNDEFVFGSSIKIRREELTPKKDKYYPKKAKKQSHETMESLRQKFDSFRKKIEKFSVPQQATQANKPAPEKIEVRREDTSEGIKDDFSESRHQKESIFCDDSYDEPALINLCDDHKLFFTDELKINEKSLNQ